MNLPHRVMPDREVCALLLLAMIFHWLYHEYIIGGHVMLVVVANISLAISLPHHCTGTLWKTELPREA